MLFSRDANQEAIIKFSVRLLFERNTLPKDASPVAVQPPEYTKNKCNLSFHFVIPTSLNLYQSLDLADVSPLFQEARIFLLPFQANTMETPTQHPAWLTAIASNTAITKAIDAQPPSFSFPTTYFSSSLAISAYLSTPPQHVQTTDPIGSTL